MSSPTDAQDKPEAPVSPEVTALRNKFVTKGGFDSAALAALVVAACEKFHTIYPMAHESRQLMDATDHAAEREKARLSKIGKLALESFLPPAPPEPTGPMRILDMEEAFKEMKPVTWEEEQEDRKRAEDWDTRRDAHREVSDCVWDTWGETILRLRNERVMAGTLKLMLTPPQGAPERGTKLLPFNALASSMDAPEMLIEGRIPLGDLVYVTGDSNAGKTTICEYQAICIATGRNFAGKRVRQGKVGWIAGEDARNTKHRFLAYADALQLTDAERALLDENLFVWPGSISMMDEDDPGLISLLIQIRATCADAKFNAFYFDSKSTTSGIKDENSNSEASAYLRKLRANFIVPFGGPTVFVLHHLTKVSADKKQTARGAGAQINDIDHEVRVESKEGSMTAVVRPGDKMRLERWTGDVFRIYQYTLDPKKYPQLVGEFGMRPISMAEPRLQPLMAPDTLTRDLRVVLKIVENRLGRALKDSAYSLSRLVDEERGHLPQKRVEQLVQSALDRGLLEVQTIEGAAKGKRSFLVLTSAGVALSKEGTKEGEKEE